MGEGEFVLDGTARPLYSTVPAPWYFGPLVQMYADVAKDRLVLRHDDLCARKAAGSLAAIGELWGYEGGRIVNINGQLPSIMADCR